MEKKRILICGAGSIGIFLGVELNLRGHDVTLFGRRKLHEVKETVFINGKEYDVPEKIFRLPRNEKYDFIFVTTKLYDFDKMIKLIKRNNIKYSIIATIQNGLVDTSKHSKILGKKIIPVVVFSGFNINNGKISVSPTKVGWITEKTPDGIEIGKLLLSSGIPCRALRKFDSLRAEKTLVNSCLNALSAIENKSFYQLFANKKISDRINHLFDECYTILSKDYALADAEEMKRNMFRNWSKLNHYSSTCQDIRSGRKNEAKFFNGYLIELGRKRGLPVQYNKEILLDIQRLKKQGLKIKQHTMSYKK